MSDMYALKEHLLLHLKIEFLRRTMVRLAERHGRHHPLVLAMSRRLDGLINEYMRVASSEYQLG